MFRQNVFGSGEDIAAQIDAQTLELGYAPVGDTYHLGPPLGPRDQSKLAARLVLRLKEDNIVPAFRRDTGGFQATGPGTHDDDPSLYACLFNEVRHRRFTPGRGVMNAKCFVTFVYTPEAIDSPHTWPNALFLVVHHFSHEMWVCKLGSG
ncbi:MAG: hypothetical protein P8O69_05040 [Amylibacter sp.]|nr:hypothetical protein [Amylibacter sp.]